jgi:hypothetical protein
MQSTAIEHNFFDQAHRAIKYRMAADWNDPYRVLESCRPDMHSIHEDIQKHPGKSSHESGLADCNQGDSVDDRSLAVTIIEENVLEEGEEALALQTGESWIGYIRQYAADEARPQYD